MVLPSPGPRKCKGFARGGGARGAEGTEHSLISYDLVLDATTQLKHRRWYTALPADTASKLNFRGFFILSRLVSRSTPPRSSPFSSRFLFPLSFSFILDTTFRQSQLRFNYSINTRPARRVFFQNFKQPVISRKYTRFNENIFLLAVKILTRPAEHFHR